MGNGKGPSHDDPSSLSFGHFFVFQIHGSMYTFLALGPVLNSIPVQYCSRRFQPSFVNPIGIYIVSVVQ